MKIPNKSDLTVIGESDSINLNSVFRIVSYIDSVSCVSCKLRLHEWKKFISYLDSVSKNSVKTYIILVLKMI